MLKFALSVILVLSVT